MYKCDINASKKKNKKKKERTSKQIKFVSIS